ncbi:hypothetical protein [Tunicatimonas pelagia]|uniref:hypothetical protein n=1 Tax=Tunicatimonas pelagia TaxID=931531 RepID=UPI002666E934|nr:hypothetical protein [Tunicatimonas pelagia]WKN42750.1 hypothetical protein P0M28_27310 [Tunicatimonas pelagia]
MRQLTLYKYTTGGLLLLNIAVLAFFLLAKPKPPRRPPSDNFQSRVINMLDLTDQQVPTFKELANAHNQKMRSIRGQQQQLLLPYFESLTDSSITIDQEGVLSQIQQLEKEKIEVTYQHLQDLKSMLTKEQLADFEEFADMLIGRLLIDTKKNPPPPKDFE